MTLLALLITGTAFGLMRIVTEAELPVPRAFAADTTTGKSPLSVGVPVMAPVLASRFRPGGRPVAA